MIVMRIPQPLVFSALTNPAIARCNRLQPSHQCKLDPVGSCSGTHVVNPQWLALMCHEKHSLNGCIVLQVCDISNPGSKCSSLGDYQCEAATCRAYTCNRATGAIAPGTCTGLCVAQSRTITSVSFDSSKSSITARLSAPAAAGFYMCSTIFNTNSSVALGLKATCLVMGSLPSDAALRITLGFDATVLAGDSLTLSSNTALVASGATKTPYNGSVTVATCGASCALPTVKISGPATLNVLSGGTPCGAAPSVVLDASYSSDSSKRIRWLATDIATAVVWSYPAGSAPAALQAAITAANAKATSR
jgi:hypothetical protein